MTDVTACFPLVHALITMPGTYVPHLGNITDTLHIFSHGHSSGTFEVIDVIGLTLT